MCRVRRRYLLQAREEQGYRAGSSRGTSAGQGFSGHGRWGECAAARRRDQRTRCSPRSLRPSPHWVAEAARRKDPKGTVTTSKRLPRTTRDVFVLHTGQSDNRTIIRSYTFRILNLSKQESAQSNLSLRLQMIQKYSHILGSPSLPRRSSGVTVM